MKKCVFLIFVFILGLCACTPKQNTALTAEPTAASEEISSAEPVEKTVDPSENTAADEQQTAVQQAMDAVTELQTVGERMESSAAFIVLDTAGKSIWKVPLAGMEFQVPDFIKDAHGGIRAMDGMEILPGTGIVGLNVYYYSMKEADYYDLLKKMADYADDTENIDEFFGLSTRYIET